MESKDVIFHEILSDQIVAASQKPPLGLFVDGNKVRVGSIAPLLILPPPALHPGSMGAINIPKSSTTLPQHEIDNNPIAHSFVTSDYDPFTIDVIQSPRNYVAQDNDHIASGPGDERCTNEHTDTQALVEDANAVALWRQDDGTQTEPVGAFAPPPAPTPASSDTSLPPRMQNPTMRLCAQNGCSYVTLCLEVVKSSVRH